MDRVALASFLRTRHKTMRAEDLSLPPARGPVNNAIRRSTVPSQFADSGLRRFRTVPTVVIAGEQRRRLV